MTLPTRILGRTGRASGLLLNVVPDGTRTYLTTGQVATLTRATVGGMTADTLGRLSPSVHSQPKYEMVDLDGDGIRETMGLLLEQPRTNAFTYSEQFDNAAWSKLTCSITPNVWRAPDGTLTADKLVEDSTASEVHWLSRTPPTLTDNTLSTYSVYARAGERSLFGVGIQKKNATTAYTYFNLATGAVGSIGSGVLARIEKFADGWYRCIVNFNPLSGGTVPVVRVFGPPSETSSWSGDGASGIYLWGAQFETDRVFHTSYIPTVASTVQRNNDSLRFTPAWPMQDVTIYAKVARAWWMDINADLGGSNHHCVVCHIEPTATTSIRLYFNSAAGSPRQIVAQVDSGASAVNPTVNCPGGQTIEICAQFINLLTAPTCRLDVGSGFGAAPSPLTETMPDGWTASGSYIGGDSTSERRLHAPLLALKVAAGARTMAEMRGLL